MIIAASAPFIAASNPSSDISLEDAAELRSLLQDMTSDLSQGFNTTDQESSLDVSQLWPELFQDNTTLPPPGFIERIYDSTSDSSIDLRTGDFPNFPRLEPRQTAVDLGTLGKGHSLELCQKRDPNF